MLDLEERARRATREAVECFRTAPTFEVSEGHRDKFQAIYPLAAHTMELVEASEILIDADLPYAAEGIARSAFQHAVTAQWVLLTSGGEQAVLAEMRRNHGTTVKDFSMSVPLPGDLLAVMDESVPSQGPARKFWEMCSRFSRDKTLYVLFRQLSDSVHPSLRTLTYHLQSDDERGVFGLVERSPSNPGPDLLASLGLSSMLALSALENLRRDQARMATVSEIAERWGIPVDLRGDDLSPDL